MESVIVAVILVAIVSIAFLYILKERKNGTRCIGCPSACHCSRGGCGSRKEK